jgi:putative addiction module component (TIGR02574 family)
MTITVDLETMSIKEKMDLIGELWNSIDESNYEIPNSHMKTLESRLNGDQRNPDPGTLWEDFRRELISR